MTGTLGLFEPKKQLTLRPYQRDCVDEIWRWLRERPGHPCVVVPGGGGKSVIIATCCRELLASAPHVRILMLTHVKELITQNASAMRAAWPGAPLGIYSAGLRSRELGEPITFAGIQSIRTRAAEVGHVDLCIIDEAHLVSMDEESGYRTLLADLLKINPRMRVVGFTATPWRLGHGLITEGDDALFRGPLIEPVSILDLVNDNYLAPLRSKVGASSISTVGLSRRSGEFVESELQARVDTESDNDRVTREIVRRGGGRKHWLVFSTGVEHAKHLAEKLNDLGVRSEAVYGEMSSQARSRAIAGFRSGSIKCISNANILTTGFDFPDIDLVALVRPTMSAALYVQMSVRGMRLKSAASDCLLLDFGGNIERHGPITNVAISNKANKPTGEAPTKACPVCDEIVIIACPRCPTCGHEFELTSTKPDPALSTDHDIMGTDDSTSTIVDWSIFEHVSRSNGKRMLRIDYHKGDFCSISEYLTVNHGGYAGMKSRQLLNRIIGWSGANVPSEMLDHDAINIEQLVAFMRSGQPPYEIDYKTEGKFSRVSRRRWGPARQKVDTNDDIPF